MVFNFTEMSRNSNLISYQDWLKQQTEERFEAQRDPRIYLEDAIAIISNMEPKEISDSKDLLLELQRILERVLTGGD